MDTITLRRVLAWCVVINYAVLVIWFWGTMAAHDWIRDLHTRWFGLSGNQFDVLNYGGMALYKMGVLFFNMVPYIALHIVGRKRSAD